MKFSKPGRTPKGQLRCNECGEVCLPKNGDWFVSIDSGNQQVFLCKKCEVKSKSRFRKASAEKN